MADLKYYDIILKPVITEKSMSMMDQKRYTFIVHPDANKIQIREAVERQVQVRKASAAIKRYSFTRKLA